MEVRFNDKELKDLFEKRRVHRKVYKSNPKLVGQYIRTIKKIENSPDFNSLKQIHSLRLKELSGDRVGFASMRINQKYRLIVFLRENDKEIVTIIEVEEISNHYS